MTERWGPYGWKTLHSVAIMYPDRPTLTDAAVAREWLENFQKSIVCPYCKVHFEKMLQHFQRQFNIFESRHTFFWFSVKAHNMVNARLGKPQVKHYREAYHMYAQRDWSGERRYYAAYVRRTVQIESGIDGFETQRQIKVVADLELTRVPQWYRAADWSNNTITALLEVDPDVEADFKPEATRTIAQVSASAGGTSPPQRLPLVRGLMGHVLSAVRIPKSLLQ